MKLIEDLAVQAGAAVGSSRPVAEELKYVPLNRYVGMSGQKFNGNLYIACGISGAGQHLKGIKDATTIVAINNNANAPIFKNADYGIVGNVEEVLPLLTAALDNGEPKKEAPPMKKMKKPFIKKRHQVLKLMYVMDAVMSTIRNLEILKTTLNLEHLLTNFLKNGFVLTVENQKKNLLRFNN